MEPTLITPPVVENIPQSPALAVEHVEEEQKVHPWARHILLIVLAILSIVIILSLIYLNGKSIYQYGV